MCRRRHAERGSALVELPLILGLMVLPFGLLILTLPLWVERQTAARDAAAEIARALVVGQPGRARGADPESLLREIEAGYELPAGSLRLDGVPVVVPGEQATVQVSVVLPGPRLPLFGSLGRRTWTAAHTERAPDYGAVAE